MFPCCWSSIMATDRTHSAWSVGLGKPDLLQQPQQHQRKTWKGREDIPTVSSWFMKTWERVERCYWLKDRGGGRGKGRGRLKQQIKFNLISAHCLGNTTLDDECFPRSSVFCSHLIGRRLCVAGRQGGGRKTRQHTRQEQSKKSEQN